MSHSLYVEQYMPAPAGSSAVADLPLVMLHGWGMNLRVFDHLREDLDPQETWAVDLPGHGKSPWWPEAASIEAQRAAVLATLPPRCVLLGWSFGAQLAMTLAAAAAPRVAALVLLAATPRFAQAPDWPHGMQAGALRDFRELLERDPARALEDFIGLQVRGSRGAGETAKALIAALAQQGGARHEALLADMTLLATQDLRAVLPGIPQPVLLVSGANDRVCLPGASRWMAETLPRASLQELPRAGHAPFISHHLEVAAAIRGFLAALPAMAPA